MRTNRQIEALVAANEGVKYQKLKALDRKHPGHTDADLLQLYRVTELARQRVKSREHLRKVRAGYGGDPIFKHSVEVIRIHRTKKDRP